MDHCQFLLLLENLSKLTSVPLEIIKKVEITVKSLTFA